MTTLLGNTTDHTVDSVAQLLTLDVEPGIYVQTRSYFNDYLTTVTKATGGSLYEITTVAAYRTKIGNPTWTPDGYGDFTLNNSNIAVIVGEYEDVTHYGIKPSTSDQTVVIQALLDRVTSTSGGRVFEFPEGDYHVINLSLSDKFGVTLKGGANSVYTVIKVAGKITCDNVGDLRVYGLKFVGDAFSFGSRTLGAITSGNYLFDMVDNCAHWDIYSCDFVGFDRVFRPDAAATSTGSYVINIHDNYFQSNNYDCEGGLVLHWNMYANTMAETTTGNMKLSLAKEVHYTNNCHENGIATMTGYNVEFTNSSAQACHSVISDNTFHEFAGFHLNNVVGVTVKGTQTRIHNTTGLDAVLIDGACDKIDLGINHFNGYDGSSFAARGLYVSGTSSDINISSGCRVFNYVTGILADNGNLLTIDGADIRGNTTAIWIQNQSTANRVNVTNCVLQGGTNALQSTGNAARWNERANTIIGGAFTNTDGYLDRYNDTGTWTPTPNSLTVVGTPTYTGTYTKIGDIYHCHASISSTTTTAATAGTTWFGGLPVSAAIDSAVMSTTTGGTLGAVGLITGTSAFVGGWTASSAVRLSFTITRV